MLTTRFEELHMEDDETQSDFYSRLCDIVNESFALSERIPSPNLCRKLLSLFLIGFNQRLQPLRKVRILIP